MKTTYKFTKNVEVYIRFSTDNELIDFMKWLGSNKIYPCLRGGMSGGKYNAYIHYFTDDDANKISEYLKSIKAHYTPLI